MSRLKLAAEGSYSARLVCTFDPLRDRLHKEVSLNLNEWIRQTHRWTSIVFTAAVIVNIIALRQKEPAVWVGLLALFPLILLLFTGLYLFVLPYAIRWRSGRRSDPSQAVETR